jgi:8-oxo-dGTP pyrophosphatase MutT (NUDIX family)
MNSVNSKFDIKTITGICNSESKFVKHITDKLNGHQQRSYIYKKTKSIDAAVLAPIFFKNNEAHLLFTKRTEQVEHHKGQISFPGGSRDDNDSCLVKTALRETEEEVGILEKDISIIGQTDLFLTNSNFLITPFVGIFKYPYPFKINDAEIDRLIEAPLSHLIRDDIFEVKPYQTDGYLWDMHYYYYGGDMIWGVTGFLLSNFLSIVFNMPRNLSIPPKLI